MGGTVDEQSISLVRSTFKAVAAADNGPERLTSSFYAILFADNPGVRELFPASMTAQRDKLVAAIAYVVDHLDDLDTTLPFLAQLGRDHRKYGIDDSHYTAVGNALLMALERFAGTEIWTDDVDAAWREAISIIAGAMMDAAHAESGPAAVGATVVEHLQVLRDMSVVRLQLDEPLRYAAGQYVSVQIPSRPRMWRYFSPAVPSNPQGQIEFHIRRVSGGWVSPAVVRRTIIGERWVIGSPLGALGVAGAQGRDMVMISSGTGIAPLRAQVMEMAARPQNPNVHLFMSGTYPCDLYDYDTLNSISTTNPWLTVIPVTENDDNPWWHDSDPTPVSRRQLAPTQVGKLVADYGTWPGHDIQIVGSPTMVKTTAHRLRAAGIDAGSIRHDPLY